MNAASSTLEILFGPYSAGRLRDARSDGGADVGPIVEAIERLQRRRRPSNSPVPAYLGYALAAYRAGAPFACLALHDAMASYVMEYDSAPEFAWAALFTAEQPPDLERRDLLDYFAPDLPHVATPTTLPLDDSARWTG